jgi:hypothetical protein
MEAAMTAIRTSIGIFGSDPQFLPSTKATSRRRKAFQGLQEFSTTAMQRFLRRKISDPKLAWGG